MKAVVFHKPNDMRVETVEDPSLKDPRDIILKVTSTAIGGSDLALTPGELPDDVCQLIKSQSVRILEAHNRVRELRDAATASS
ncbi:MAG TPA: hypothetical protein VIT00_14940 [Terrimicrobiaceae bacterium]